MALGSPQVPLQKSPARGSNPLAASRSMINVQEAERNSTRVRPRGLSRIASVPVISHVSSCRENAPTQDLNPLLFEDDDLFLQISPTVPPTSTPATPSPTSLPLTPSLTKDAQVTPPVVLAEGEDTGATSEASAPVQVSACRIQGAGCDGTAVTTPHLPEHAMESNGFKEIYSAIRGYGRPFLDWKALLKEERANWGMFVQ